MTCDYALCSAHGFVRNTAGIIHEGMDGVFVVVNFSYGKKLRHEELWVYSTTRRCGVDYYGSV